jgi:hypothetical protein
MTTKAETFEVGDRVRAFCDVMGDDHCGDERVLIGGAIGRVDTVWACGEIDVSFPCGMARDGTDAFIVNQFDPDEFGVFIVKESGL